MSVIEGFISNFDLQSAEKYNGQLLDSLIDSIKGFFSCSGNSDDNIIHCLSKWKIFDFAERRINTAFKESILSTANSFALKIVNMLLAHERVFVYLCSTESSILDEISATCASPHECSVETLCTIINAVTSHKAGQEWIVQNSIYPTFFASIHTLNVWSSKLNHWIFSLATRDRRFSVELLKFVGENVERSFRCGINKEVFSPIGLIKCVKKMLHKFLEVRHMICDECAAVLQNVSCSINTSVSVNVVNSAVMEYSVLLPYIQATLIYAGCGSAVDLDSSAVMFAEFCVSRNDLISLTGCLLDICLLSTYPSKGLLSCLTTPLLFYCHQFVNQSSEVEKFQLSDSFLQLFEKSSKFNEICDLLRSSSASSISKLRRVFLSRVDHDIDLTLYPGYASNDDRTLCLIYAWLSVVTLEPSRISCREVGEVMIFVGSFLRLLPNNLLYIDSFITTSLLTAISITKTSFYLVHTLTCFSRSIKYLPTVDIEMNVSAVVFPLLDSGTTEIVETLADVTLSLMQTLVDRNEIFSELGNFVARVIAELTSLGADSFAPASAIVDACSHAIEIKNSCYYIFRDMLLSSSFESLLSINKSKRVTVSIVGVKLLTTYCRHVDEFGHVSSFEWSESELVRKYVCAGLVCNDESVCKLAELYCSLLLQKQSAILICTSNITMCLTDGLLLGLLLRCSDHDSEHKLLSSILHTVECISSNVMAEKPILTSNKETPFSIPAYSSNIVADLMRTTTYELIQKWNCQSVSNCSYCFDNIRLSMDYLSISAEQFISDARTILRGNISSFLSDFKSRSPTESLSKSTCQDEIRKIEDKIQEIMRCEEMDRTTDTVSDCY